MAESLDFSTNNGKVRALISDTDITDPIFPYQATDQIDVFLGIEGDDIKKAAALALLTIAANEVMVQKVIKILDISTNGAAVAESLRKLAKDLRDQAEMDDLEGAVDTATMVINQTQWQSVLDNMRV